MTEDAPEEATQRPSGPGLGAALHAARVDKGMSPRDAAEALHLSESTITAMEAEDWDALPPAPFTTGYVRTYARLVEVDPAIIDQHLGALQSTREKDPPLRVSGPVQTAPQMPRLLARTGIAVVVVALVAGAGWWLADRALPSSVAGLSFWSSEETGESRDITADEAAPAEPEGGDTGPAPGEIADGPGDDDQPGDERREAGGERDTGDVAGEPAEAATGTVEQAPAPDQEEGDPARSDDLALEGGPGDDGAADESEPDSEAGAGEGLTAPGGGTLDAPADGLASPDDLTPESLETGPDAPDVGSPAEELEEAGSAAGESMASAAEETGESGSEPPPAEPQELELDFSGPSWVEITDARGERLLYGLIREEGRQTLEGEAPFSVVIGDVTQVDVFFDGSEVDLGSEDPGRVVRVEVP
ncbi:DUF4115 domain-containing protein [Aquisalimonas lutea]|uniref:RodZ domain-containing protein n=1 Tax=Aquisalimonas lutea TaxID=1327750 RepID=UPI0025B4FFDD|nr:RodZ domain-containing protein [Aquisalimonas lutea]MDN3517905.1 DUF4115 domain-containing protein [Aquisalimonas lutea]